MKPLSLFVLVLVTLSTSECFNILGWQPEQAQSPIWPNVKYIFPYPIQSPVNIITANAARRKLNPLRINFPWDSPKEIIYIENTGYYLEVYLPDEVEERPYVSGGPLFEEKYIFEQLHFHWGQTDDCGSENHLDGKCFPTEVHCVFYNEIYGSLEEAVNHADGVTVVAIFGERTPKNTDNPDLKSLFAKLSEIIQPGSVTTSSFKIEFLFMKNAMNEQNYYAFPGSLTTPPYSECVTWIICPQPFGISSRQVDEFRKLKATNGSQLRDNVRPLQDFAGRPLVTPLNN